MSDQFGWCGEDIYGKAMFKCCRIDAKERKEDRKPKTAAQFLDQHLIYEGG